MLVVITVYMPERVISNYSMNYISKTTYNIQKFMHKYTNVV